MFRSALIWVLEARASSPVLALLTLAFVLPCAAQKHPFTFEDMMKLKRVKEPVVSPDGKWMLFAAVDVDLQANTKTPHVWVVPLDSHFSHNQAEVGHPTSAQLSNSSETQNGVPHVSPGLRDRGETNEREIISDRDADRPRWAPDGKRFAFVSTKENGSQIWIADFDDVAGTVSSVQKLTSIATEAGGELWSPDGKNILFTSDVYPECDGRDEYVCNAKKVKAAEESKVKALVFDHLLYRHWNAYKDGKRSHIFVTQVPALRPRNEPVDYITPFPRDLTPGDYDAPVFSLGGQDDYAFSPDGKEICYASNHDAMPAASTNNDLFTVPVNWPPDATSAQVLAATKNITADNKAADQTPLYSPDGKYIAYRAQQRPGYESDRFRLMLYDRKTGEKKNLTERFDRWVGTFAWAPNSSSVYFASENRGGSPLWKLELKEIAPGVSAVPSMVIGGYDDDLAITSDGKWVVFNQMSIAGPNEISKAATDFPVCRVMWDEIWKKDNLPSIHYTGPDCLLSKPEPVTHLNDAVLSQVSMSPLEPFWFTAANNDQVQGFLVKPPNFDPSKKYPVKFLIHGGPQGAWGDDWSYRWNPELFAANGYLVIMINFHGSTGYGQKFIDAINGDWGGAPFEDLMKGLDYAEQHYPFIGKDRECALGASYGGYMANWILGHSNRFKCIVSHDSTFNTESAYGDTEELWFPEWEFKGTPWTNRELYRKWSPHMFAANFTTPTLVIHGQLDYRLDVSQGFDLFTTLQRQGVPSKMLYFPDEGHWVLKPQNSQLWYKTVNDWVDQWIGK